MRRLHDESGQTVVEYALLYAGVILPLTFAIVFLGEMLWVWHSVVDYTRDGARYAAVAEPFRDLPGGHVISGA